MRRAAGTDPELFVMPPVKSPPLAKEILSAAATLERGSESVRAVVNSEENRFSRALEALRELAVHEGIPIAIVGGLGAIRYGYPAATQDINVAVARDDLDRLIDTASQYGFQVAWKAKSGWHTLLHGDVEINVVPEGGKARDSSPTTIPGPARLGVSQGLDYASLAGWIELKISSGRQKDRAHVVEVMKKTAAETIQEVREHVAQVHQLYLTLFDQRWEEAREEMSQERERGEPGT